MATRRRKNPSRHQALLYIGRLMSLEIIDAQGRRSTRRTPGAHLAWDGRRRAFVIGRSPKNAGDLGNIPDSVLSAHRRFHGASAARSITLDIPDQTPTRTLGLIDALTYQVPNKVNSPTKLRHYWRHKFGDTKHSGNSDKGTRVMPALGQDAQGRLHIVRRPGNIFKVSDWLRG
jgi:hypothetical protein